MKKTCTCCKRTLRIEKFPKCRDVCKSCWAGGERDKAERQKNERIAKVINWAVPLLLVIATYSHESVDGAVKICYYRAIYGEHALTVNAVQMCPMTAKFEV